MAEVDFSRFTHLPSLIAFDLDYTLWPLWIDTHLNGPPFSTEGFSVVDCSGNGVSLYDDIPAILRRLREHHPEIKLAIASRTHAPEYADEILDMLHVAPADHRGGGVVSKRRRGSAVEVNPISHPPLRSYFHVFEIYPSDKQAHFKSIHKKTGVPLENMLFFDDERRNIVSVGKLGVTCIDVGRTGTTLVKFLEGLQKYQERKRGGEALKTWLKGGKGGVGGGGFENDGGQDFEFTVQNGRT
ncbi:Magnesium-dependent phosphatase 1 [Rhizophlyctis rosea]|nr:Magnesium-dependent phosphatase 1 [Rhizophlyctis rosea]